METLRIIEHGNGHTDIEALIYGEWVVVKCVEEKNTKQEQNMNIYKVYRTDPIGLDEYDSAVVVAENEQQARDLCPFEASDTDIVKAEIVDDKVAGVVVSSFNAG